MKKTTFAVILIVALALASASFNCAKQNAAKPKTDASNSAVKQAEPADEFSAATLAKGKTALVVYYFHGNKRCKSCVQMQEWVQNSLNKNFKAELDSGKIIWREINYDEPARAHFRADYKLMFPTAIAASVKSGQQTGFISLEDAWDFADNAAKLDNFVTDKIKAALEGLN